MIFSPLRRAPMMLGGVGFQAGLDEAARKKQQAARAPVQVDVARHLTSLEGLRNAGVISPEEFETFKRRVLDASTG